MDMQLPMSLLLCTEGMLLPSPIYHGFITKDVQDLAKPSPEQS